MDQAMIDSMPYRFLLILILWGLVISIFFAVRWYIEHHEEANQSIDAWLKAKRASKRGDVVELRPAHNDESAGVAGDTEKRA